MTEEDAEALGMGHHRRLEQRLVPRSPVPANRKKKLVNFKVSRRIRSLRGDSNNSKDQRRGSSCSTTGLSPNPLPPPPSHPSIMSKKKVGDEGDRKTRTPNTVEWDLDQGANYRHKESSEGYICDSGGHSESIYQEDCAARKDNRSVKERREDFRNVHERSRQQQDSFRQGTERRGGILHISADGPDDVDYRNMNNNNRSTYMQDNQPLSHHHMRSCDRNSNGRIPGGILRQQSFPEEKDLVGHRRSSIPEDIALSRRSSIPDNFLDRRSAPLFEEGNLHLRRPSSVSASKGHLSRQPSIPEEDHQCQLDDPEEGHITIGRQTRVACEKRRPSIPEDIHNNNRSMLNKTNHTIATQKAQQGVAGGRVRRPPDIAMTQRSHSTSSWDRVRGATISEGDEGAMSPKFGVVVEMVTARRRASLAPTLWTPAVKRSPPGPRPVNFDEQVCTPVH